MYLQKITDHPDTKFFVETAEGEKNPGKIPAQRSEILGDVGISKPRVLQLYRVSAFQAEKSRSNSAAYFNLRKGGKK